MIRAIASIEDLATGSTTILLEARKVDGSTTEIDIERQLIFDNRRLVAELASRNVALPRNSAERNALLDAAFDESSIETMYRVARPGWQEGAGSHVFATHARVVPDAADGKRLLPPRTAPAQRFTTSTADTLAGWQKAIGRKVLVSDVATLAVAAAFAAPLVRLAGLQPFVIALHGPSKAGKTTALLAAGSVIGLGEESALPSWNMTTAAFTETARQFNDHILIMDETGTIEGGPDRAHAVIAQLVFQYATGTDRARHSGTSFATGQVMAASSGILLTSTEYAFAEFAARAGRARIGGELARAIDVPAVGRGRATIIDRPRDDDTEAWSRRRLASLRRAAARYHGVAFDAYVEALTARVAKPSFVRELRARIDAVLAKMDLTGASEAERHAARNLALIAVGGELAVEFGIWIATHGCVERAVLRCYARSLARPGAPPLRPVAARVEAVLTDRLREKYPIETAIAAEPALRWSAFHRQRKGRTVLVVANSAFRKWFVTKAEALDALRALHAAGCLRLNGRGCEGRVDFTTATHMEKRVPRAGSATTRTLRIVGRKWRAVRRDG